MDVHACISTVFLFDDDQMGYVNFLEALVRVAVAYPFTDVELADLVSFEMKMQYFTQRLE